MKTTKRIAFLGVMAALAIVLSYLESLLPPLMAAVPGIKLGLPNLIIVILLYTCNLKQTAIVSLVRLLTVSLLFGSVLTFAYSFAGAFLSLAVMALLKKTQIFSPVGVSVAGGVSHNLGQIIVAAIVLQTKEIGYYFPILSVSGIVAGVLIGVAAALLLKRVEKLKIFE